MKGFIKVGKIEVYPVWFESLGAKSSCVFVKTPDTKILIDPGAAIMQPSFPLSDREKEFLKKEALKRIQEFSKTSEIIIITHYHYDHHFIPTKKTNIYSGKTVLIKNPNIWINRSQFFRARNFIKRLCRLEKVSFKNLLTSPQKLKLIDPVENLEHSQLKGERVFKGKKWLKKLFKLWNEEKHITEWESSLKIIFADNKRFSFGNTQIEFSEPLFHGIEYDRLGWVIMVTIRYQNKKILYTSDIQGSPIKEYAEKIMRIKPDILIMDGPATYLLGYLLNRENLERSIENTSQIVRNANIKLVIYDHHLLRDINYEEKIKPLYEKISGYREKIICASQILGKTPLAKTLSSTHSSI